jgi:hypothetical protein
MEWLVSVGCLVDLVISNGHSVLNEAAQRGRKDSICPWFFARILHLDQTAEHSGNTGMPIDLLLVAPDSNGYTTSDLAGMEGHEELASKGDGFGSSPAQQSTFTPPPEWLVQESKATTP